MYNIRGGGGGGGGGDLCRMCLQEVPVVECEWKFAASISSNNNQQLFKTSI